MPKKYKTKILEKKNLAADYWYLKLEKPVGFTYDAGQFVSMLVDTQTQMRRSYSLASYPALDYLELLVDTKPMGVGSKFILSLKEGQELEILGPLGEFKLTGSNDEKRFIATGCGVVPVRSMIHDLLETKNFKGVVILNWGMRFESDLFWMDEWAELKNKYPNFEFDLVLSKPTEKWRGCLGHIQDCLLKKQIEKETEAYICGNKEMVEGMKDNLSKLGLAPEKIHFERFN